MNEQQVIRESICALVDGQLQGEAFERAVELAHADADARSCWQAYHLVGDVLRSHDLSHGVLGTGFASRLQARLQHERMETPVAQATPGAPDAKPGTKPDAMVANAQPVPLVPAAPLAAHRRAAANTAVFRWKLMAVAASLAAVTAIGWNLLGTALPSASPAPALALSSTPAPTLALSTSPALAPDDTPMVMLRDPQLDALLAAHKQLGGTSALQASTGFLRNATFESPAR